MLNNCSEQHRANHVDTILYVHYSKAKQGIMEREIGEREGMTVWISQRLIFSRTRRVFPVGMGNLQD